MSDNQQNFENRAEDIRAALSYLGKRLDQLNQDLRQTETTSAVPEFLSNQVADILTNCRDCLDWCASDVAGIAGLSDTKGIYFPFSRKMMKESNFIRRLEASRPDIHACLLTLVTRIESDERVRGQDISYRMLEQLRELSAHKRHNIQLRSVRIDQAGTRVSYPNGQSMSMKLWEVEDFRDVDSTKPTPDAWTANSPDATLSSVSEFRLTSNNWEVSRFCDHCCRIVVVVLNEIYGAFFGERHSFHPNVTAQLARVELINRTLGHLLPFCWHPMKLAFGLEEKVTPPIEISFGSTITASGDIKYQAFVPATVHLAFTIIQLQMRKIEDYLLENAAQFSTDQAWRFMLRTPKLDSPITLARQESRLDLDHVIFWMEVRFKTTSPIQFSAADVSLGTKLARAFFPPTARYGVMNSEGKGVWLEVGPLGHQIVNELEENKNTLE